MVFRYCLVLPAFRCRNRHLHGRQTDRDAVRRQSIPDGDRDIRERLRAVPILIDVGFRPRPGKRQSKPVRHIGRDEDPSSEPFLRRCFLFRRNDFCIIPFLLPCSCLLPAFFRLPDDRSPNDKIIPYAGKNLEFQNRHILVVQGEVALLLPHIRHMEPDIFCLRRCFQNHILHQALRCAELCRRAPVPSIFRNLDRTRCHIHALPDDPYSADLRPFRKNHLKPVIMIFRGICRGPAVRRIVGYAVSRKRSREFPALRAVRPDPHPRFQAEILTDRPHPESLRHLLCLKYLPGRLRHSSRPECLSPHEEQKSGCRNEINQDQPCHKQEPVYLPPCAAGAKIILTAAALRRLHPCV